MGGPERVFMRDLAMKEILRKEEDRQRHNIELIASENFVSDDVREAVGSVLTNKYAEGYPGKRYYGGCEVVDESERLAIERCKTLFGAEHVNVQPHSGSAANMAVYRTVLQQGDTVLGMSLDAGGHLTHGHKLSFSGHDYACYGYGVDPKTEMIDYDALEEQALTLRPKMIIAGASAYARFIDYKRIREIADKINAVVMVDMAHVAGLIAAGLHPNPVPYADFVTSTTHKTLRGPRGGLILCREKYAKDLDRAVFPGIQGGPLCHVIAGKAVAFYEALQPEFREYQERVIRNAKVLAETLQSEGVRIVSGGTDNHMVLADTKTGFGLTGKAVETALDKVCITVNKNAIPFDTEKPAYTSGIRLGTPAMTTRGFGEEEFRLVGHWIAEVMRHPEDEEVLSKIRKQVLELTSKFE